MIDKSRVTKLAFLGGFIGLDKWATDRKGWAIFYTLFGLGGLFGSAANINAGTISFIVFLNVVIGLNYYLRSQEWFDKKFNSQVIQREILNTLNNK